MSATSAADQRSGGSASGPALRSSGVSADDEVAHGEELPVLRPAGTVLIGGWKFDRSDQLLDLLKKVAKNIVNCCGEKKGRVPKPFVLRTGRWSEKDGFEIPFDIVQGDHVIYLCWAVCFSEHGSTALETMLPYFDRKSEWAKLVAEQFKLNLDTARVRMVTRFVPQRYDASDSDSEFDKKGSGSESDSE